MNHVGITTFFCVLLAVFIGVIAGVAALTFKIVVSYPAVSAALIALAVVYIYRKGK